MNARLATLAITFVAASALSLGAVHAQISTTLLSTTETPRSIVLVPTSTGLHAICSMTQQSRQYPVNVTNPAIPVVGTSANYTKDQYCDGVQIPAHGGRLLTAHRGGDIAMWDATVPSLPGPLSPTTVAATNYSHEGLKAYTSFAGPTYLMYSEQHTSSTTFGGLKTYLVNPTSLTPIGQTLFLGGAGGALEIGGFGRVVWQLGDQGNSNFNGVLRTYDPNVLAGNPILKSTVNYPLQYPYADADLELNKSQSVLIGAHGWDGLTAINVTNPYFPSINTMLGAQQVIFFDGVTFVPNTDMALIWGFIRIGTVDTPFFLFGNTFVSGPSAFFSPVGPAFYPGVRIDDCKFSTSGPLRLYVVGRHMSTNASYLYIYP